jgi:phenylacetate-CoA ligase
MLATPELLHEAHLPFRLGEVLPRWIREVPLYEGLPRLEPPPGEPLPGDFLSALPFITKSDIRRSFPDNFLRPGETLDSLIDNDLVELEHTSGTSEERTPLLLGRGWWAEQEERALRLNAQVAEVLDQHPHARRVTLSSPSCNSDICYTGVPSRAQRVVGNSLFSSLSRFPFLWGDADLARIAAEVSEWKPLFLDVDPVYGVVFALYCERQGLRFPSVRFVLCSYEYVSVAHRRILERVFGVPVYNLYGSTETGHLLMETTEGDMRPSLSTAYLEVLEPDGQGIGELVVTTLTNDFMPLIRYRIGDLVRRCRRPYATRYFVHGRVMDAFITPDGGQRVTTWQIDQCFQDLPGVAHYQLSETAEGGCLLRVVREGAGLSDHAMGGLKERLAQVLGGVEPLEVELVDGLMPERSGKFRLCHPRPRPIS